MGRQNFFVKGVVHRIQLHLPDFRRIFTTPIMHLRCDLNAVRMRLVAPGFQSGRILPHSLTCRLIETFLHDFEFSLFRRALLLAGARYGVRGDGGRKWLSVKNCRERREARERRERKGSFLLQNLLTEARRHGDCLTTGTLEIGRGEDLRNYGGLVRGVQLSCQ